jgi:membrane dipeptidase
MTARRPSSPAAVLVLSIVALAAAAGGWWAAGRIAPAAANPAPAPTVAPDPGALAERAAELARRWTLVDTHIDLPYRRTETGEAPASIAGRTERGDFDAVRARQGGLDVAWMSIYVPAAYQESGGAKAFADTLIDGVEAMAAASPEVFAVVGTVAEAEAAVAAGRIALPLGIENAAAFEDDLAHVAHFVGRGVRYATLTHGKDNLLGDSSYTPPAERTWHGLSPYGREVVAEMNRLGMLVDLSHVSDETFDDAIEMVIAPPIASHSSCRHFTPGFERNLDDERIVKLAGKGGVIQINFGSSFLTAAANAWSLDAWKAEQAFRAEQGAKEGSAELDAFRAEYVKQHPMPRATLDDVVAHIEHVIAIAGVDHVGLGSDFDGVGPTLPTGLADVSMYPNLIAALLARGHSEADVEKIAGGNLLRVWREAERVAAGAGAPAPGAE